jgi:hypothetical protein
MNDVQYRCILGVVSSPDPMETRFALMILLSTSSEYVISLGIQNSIVLHRVLDFQKHNEVTHLQ